MKNQIKHLLIALALLADIDPAAAQGATAFTYQGQLRDGGTNANDTYTMIFGLYDTATSGNQIGSTITTSPTLANGLFSVNLDFGAGAFDGSARWLDITITKGDMTQTLSPRVQVLPAPYALYSGVAANLSNSPYTTSVGSGAGPGGHSFTNALIFSASGVPLLNLVAMTPGGPAVWVPGQLGVGVEVDCGEMNVRNSTWDPVVHIDSGGNISANGTVSASSFATTSDRNLKEKFTPTDNREILERVARLPISCWNFKNDSATRHIGPMAQDFYAAFNVGADNKHIATVDEDGVALAAIQGLNEKLEERDAHIQALEKRLTDLEKLVNPSAQK